MGGGKARSAEDVAACVDRIYSSLPAVQAYARDVIVPLAEAGAGMARETLELPKDAAVLGGLDGAVIEYNGPKVRRYSALLSEADVLAWSGDVELGLRGTKSYDCMAVELMGADIPKGAKEGRFVDAIVDEARRLGIILEEGQPEDGGKENRIYISERNFYTEDDKVERRRHVSIEFALPGRRLGREDVKTILASPYLP